MKKLFILSTSLFFIWSFLLSCGKERSEQIDYKNSFGDWEFKEAANNYSGNIDTASYVAGSNGTDLVLEGKSQDNTGTVLITIHDFNRFSPDTFPERQVSFAYMKNNSLFYQKDSGSFQITITHIDSASVSGTFSGSVRDANDMAKPIRDGRFSAKLKFVPTIPPSTDSGWISFWSRSNPNGGGPITVTLNDKKETISKFSNDAPADCQTAGTARFKLPVGTYSWAARPSSDSVYGTVTITKDTCIKTEVVLHKINQQTGQVVFWATGSCTQGGGIKIVVDEKETKKITVFNISEPVDCYPGESSYALSPGKHTWKAYCGTADSVEGEINVTLGQCVKERISFPIPAANFELTPNACSEANVWGTFSPGTTLNPSNTISLNVNVTTPGSYTVMTGTANGMSFAGSGVFPITGPQHITLYGSGTPNEAATTNVPLTIGSTNCSVQIHVTEPTLKDNTWSFNEGAATYSGIFGSSNDFKDDVTSGKVLNLYGGTTSGDTTFFVKIHFDGNPSQPIAGNYVSDPNVASPNSTQVLLFTGSPPNPNKIYYQKCIACTPSNLHITISVISYNPTTKEVTGTFSGSSWNKNGQGVNITYGRFKATL